MNAMPNLTVNTLIAKFRDHVEQLRGTELERKVKEATSSADWGVTGQIKEDIARATLEYQSCSEVMSIIWKRMGESGKNWRMVFKSLDLLEYLLRRGSERAIDEAHQRQYQIRTLKDFHFTESDGRDRGGGIREKARLILDLLNDKKALEQERVRARAQIGKYTGMSHYDTYRSSYHNTSSLSHRNTNSADLGSGGNDSSIVAARTSTKKKNKQKKKSKKGQQMATPSDLSDDVLSDSDDGSAQPTQRISYEVDGPNPVPKGKKKKRKKQQQSQERSGNEIIPDLLTGFNATPPASSGGFTEEISFPSPETWPSSSSAPHASSSQDHVKGDLFHQWSAFPADSALQSQPPIGFNDQHQISVVRETITSHEFLNLSPAPAAPAAESDSDDWGFISAKPQVNLFSPPSNAAPVQSSLAVDPFWDGLMDLSSLSLSPTLPQGSTQNQSSRFQPTQSPVLFPSSDFQSSQSPSDSRRR